MKKFILISALLLCVMLVVSCDHSLETNYSDYGHYGKVIVHNEVSSGANIWNINISDTSSYRGKTYYDESVNIFSGNNSKEYKIELIGSMDAKTNTSRFTVTITLSDGTTKSKDILAYEDIANHLYYNGTDLVERK